ncbi:hypothetical protein C5167_044861, partial [Papaver somniferum]
YLYDYIKLICNLDNTVALQVKENVDTVRGIYNKKVLGESDFVGQRPCDDDGNSQSNEGGRKVKYQLIAYHAIQT